MQSTERMVESGQAVMGTPDNDDEGDETSTAAREKIPITSLLRRLRGSRTLRHVESETGISNAYLSNLESGAKRPGVKILTKLAAYYSVPLKDLLQAAGMPFDENAAALAASVSDIQRSYEFVMGDPNLTPYRKPAGTPPEDMQKFLVQMYEHYTGRKLL